MTDIYSSGDREPDMPEEEFSVESEALGEYPYEVWLRTLRDVEILFHEEVEHLVYPMQERFVLLLRRFEQRLLSDVTMQKRGGKRVHISQNFLMSVEERVEDLIRSLKEFSDIQEGDIVRLWMYILAAFPKNTAAVRLAVYGEDFWERRVQLITGFLADEHIRTALGYRLVKECIKDELAEYGSLNVKKKQQWYQENRAYRYLMVKLTEALEDFLRHVETDITMTNMHEAPIDNAMQARVNAMIMGKAEGMYVVFSPVVETHFSSEDLKSTKVEEEHVPLCSVMPYEQPLGAGGAVVLHIPEEELGNFSLGDRIHECGLDFSQARSFAVSVVCFVEGVDMGKSEDDSSDVSDQEYVHLSTENHTGYRYPGVYPKELHPLGNLDWYLDLIHLGFHSAGISCYFLERSEDTTLPFGDFVVDLQKQQILWQNPKALEGEEGTYLHLLDIPVHFSRKVEK